MGNHAIAQTRDAEELAASRVRSRSLGPRARGPVRWWRVTLAGSSFFFFGLGGALLGWLVLPLVWLVGGGSRSERRLRCQRTVQFAYRVFHEYMRVCRLLEFSSSATARNAAWPKHTQAILVANHPTLIDTPAILACMGTLCCVVTPWFGRNPLLAPLLRLCGHIVQQGDSLAARLRVVELARQRLSEGHSLLIFPEGTRSPPGKLGHFQRGCFELALRARVPIYPVAISVHPHVLTGKTPWHDLPPCTANYRLEPLEPWLPHDYPVDRESARALAHNVRRELAKHLEIPV